jgi:hypothetical protein
MFSAKHRWLSLLSASAILLVLPFLMAAGERTVKNNGAYNPDNETVEMFQAMKDGQIAVKFIPKDSKQANVLIENKTDKPLNVKLPEAFAGMPVLPQFGGGNQRSNNSGNNNNNSNQSMGGGMGGGGMGMGGMGMGMFNVAPEKVGKIKVDTVCLEHGKAEPRAAVPYEIKPIESFTTKSGVKELCQMLGTGQLDQRAAQAAAWHLSNDMSWQELAAKHYKYANGMTKPYFSQQELQAAMAVAGNALKTAKENEKQNPSPSGTENYETPTRK